MKKKAGYIFAAILLAISPALAQQLPPIVNGQFYSVGWSLQNPPLPVPSASITLVGNPGPATYNFWIVANYTIGNSQPAGPFTLSSGPNSFSASNYARVSWTGAPGALTYDVLETPTSFPPSGACGCAVATGQVGSTFNVVSNSLNAYVVSSIDANYYTVTSQNAGSASGVSKLLFQLPDGTFMGSLDTTGHLIVNSCTGCGPGGGNLFPGGAYQVVNYGATGGTNGYPDMFVTSSPGLFLSTASGGIQSYGGFTSGGGSPAINGVLTLDSTSAGVVNGGWSLTPSPTFTAPGYGWYLPDADAAGCLQSPGGGTPGSPSQLSIGACAFGSGTTNYIPKWTAAQTQGNSDFGNFVSNRLNCAGSGCTATYGGDQDNAGNNAALGSVIVRGADQGSAAGSASVAGQVYIRGGNSAAASGGTAGSTEIAAGENTGGANPGLLTAVQAYTWSVTSPTQYYLQCPSAVGAKAVADCGASPGNWIGVAQSVSARAVNVIVPPFEAPIAASAGVTLGHTVCAGATAGEVTDSGGTGPCAPNQGTTVGVVEDIGSATYYFGDGTSFTTSTTLPLVTMNTATLASQTAISIPALEINGTPATPIANLNGTTPAAQSNYINATWQSSVSGTTTSASVEVPYCSSSVFGVCEVDGTTITATAGVISAALATPYTIRSCEIVVGGTGASGVLQTGDDTIGNGSCLNGTAVTETIRGVYCLADTGTTTTTTPIIHGGGTILTGPLTCGNNVLSSAGTLSGTPMISPLAMVDPGMTAVGTAHVLHVYIIYTVPAS